MAPEDGLAALHAIRCEIVSGEIAAVFSRLIDDGLADIAVDEKARAVFGKPFETFGESFIAEGGAGPHRLATGCKNLRHTRARGQDRRDHGEEIGLEIRQREALLRGADGGLGEPLHRPPAKLLMHGEQTRHDPGRGTRTEPDMEFLLHRTEIGFDRIELDVALGPSRLGCLREKIVERDFVAAGAARHEKAAAPGRCEHGLGDEGHVETGDASVEGVAAIFENFRGGLRGQFVTGRHHAFGLCHAVCLRCRCARRQVSCAKITNEMAGTLPGHDAILFDDIAD